MIQNRYVVVSILGIVVLAIFFLMPKRSERMSGDVEAGPALAVSQNIPQQQFPQNESTLTNSPQDIQPVVDAQAGEITAYQGALIEDFPKESETINLHVVFSKADVPGKTIIHDVVSGDTLGKIAKKYGTTVDLIKKSNGLSSDVIRIGQKLRVWTGKFNIQVDKSENILVVKDGEEVVKAYKVATGRDNSTPVGTFTIQTKIANPVWFHQGQGVVPPEDPKNELGSRWLGWNLDGYGIHGTIRPESIGQQATHGCVRMLNQDVEELFNMIPQGTEVIVVN